MFTILVILLRQTCLEVLIILNGIYALWLTSAPHPLPLRGVPQKLNPQSCGSLSSQTHNFSTKPNREIQANQLTEHAHARPTSHSLHQQQPQEKRSQYNSISKVWRGKKPRRGTGNGLMWRCVVRWWWCSVRR